MRGCRSIWLLVCAIATGASWAAAASVERFEIVLEGGRVMDPETGFDAVSNVGIRSGKVVAISQSGLEGDVVVDVSGLVVAPGFIDLHAHGQNNVANALQARDGVTTALELEAGTYPVQPAYDARDGRSILNFGYSVQHHGARRQAKLREGEAEETLRDRAYYEPAAGAELAHTLDLIGEEIRAGALGIGVGIEYTPGVGREEIFRLFEAAAAHEAPLFIHVRRSPGGDPAPEVEAQQAQEVIANAAAAGASLHICHVSSTGLSATGLILELVDGARKSGVDVTTEAYPYTAGSTNLGTALFGPGWQERLGGIDYGDLVWTATGERLTAESFDRYRAQAQEEGRGSVVVHFVPELAMNQAIEHPEVMIASDGGGWATPLEHPRGSGTYARVLGRYVRERGTLDLMTALRKMSLLPAQRLEAIAPAMRHKGRIRVDADADLVVFDPDSVIDQATYTAPMLPSIGIQHVLVNGTFVVRDGVNVAGVYPGVAIRNRYVE